MARAAKAAAKPASAVTPAAEPPRGMVAAPPQAAEITGAGAGGEGEVSAAASVAVGDAAQEPIPPTPAADAAGHPAAPEAAGILPGRPALPPAKQVGAALLLLCNVQHGGDALAEGSNVTLPEEVAERLVATGAARRIEA